MLNFLLFCYSISITISITIVSDTFDYSSINTSGWTKTGVNLLGLVEIELTDLCGASNETSYACFKISETIVGSQTMITNSFNISGYENIKLDITLSPIGMLTGNGFIQYTCDNGNVIYTKTVSSELYSTEYVTFNVTCPSNTESLGIQIGLNNIILSQLSLAALYVDNLLIYGDIITTKAPTFTRNPTQLPTLIPTNLPTINPTVYPSITPTIITQIPTIQPSKYPTKIPSIFPTKIPTNVPSYNPTLQSLNPTIIPSNIPTIYPTIITQTPSNTPTIIPTKLPTIPQTTIFLGDTKNTSKLTNEMIIGIVVGSIFILVIIIVAVILSYKYTNKKLNNNKNNPNKIQNNSMMTSSSNNNGKNALAISEQQIQISAGSLSATAATLTATDSNKNSSENELKSKNIELQIENDQVIANEYQQNVNDVHFMTKGMISMDTKGETIDGEISIGGDDDDEGEGNNTI